MWLDRESEIDLLAYSPFAELITNPELFMMI